MDGDSHEIGTVVKALGLHKATITARRFDADRACARLGPASARRAGVGKGCTLIDPDHGPS
jgi:hypothetical protein